MLLDESKVCCPFKTFFFQLLCIEIYSRWNSNDDIYVNTNPCRTKVNVIFITKYSANFLVSWNFFKWLVSRPILYNSGYFDRPLVISPNKKINLVKVTLNYLTCSLFFAYGYDSHSNDWLLKNVKLFDAGMKSNKNKEKIPYNLTKLQS